MAEQIRVDEVITNIMYGVTAIIEGHERLNQVRAVLYMTLANTQIYREETGLTTQLDSSVEWVRLYLASMAVRGCTAATVESYRQEYRMFFGMVPKPIPEITTGDIRGYLAHCKLVRGNSDTTVNNKTRVLRGLFRWLSEEEYINKNPMTRIKDNKVEHRVKDTFEDE